MAEHSSGAKGFTCHILVAHAYPIHCKLHVTVYCAAMECIFFICIAVVTSALQHMQQMQALHHLECAYYMQYMHWYRVIGQVQCTKMTSAMECYWTLEAYPHCMQLGMTIPGKLPAWKINAMQQILCHTFTSDFVTTLWCVLCHRTLRAIRLYTISVYGTFMWVEGFSLCAFSVLSGIMWWEETGLLYQFISMHAITLRLRGHELLKNTVDIRDHRLVQLIIPIDLVLVCCCIWINRIELINI